jgi:glycogen operon protein
MIGIRRAHPVFRRHRFFQGRAIHGAGIKDIVWLRPDGGEMTDDEWEHAFARSLGVYLAGAALQEIDRRGHRITDNNFLVLLSSHHEEIPFTLPAPRPGTAWQVLVDTAYEQGLAMDGRYPGTARYPLQGRSLALLMEVEAAA